MQAGNLVFQFSTTTGTGDFTLSAMSADSPAHYFRNFSDAFGTGSSNKFYYMIRSRDGLAWEVGQGYLSDATTLVRETVIESSNANDLVNFGNGTKDVISDIPAAYQNRGVGDGYYILEHAAFRLPNTWDCFVNSQSGSGASSLAALTTKLDGFKYPPLILTTGTTTTGGANIQNRTSHALGNVNDGAEWRMKTRINVEDAPDVTEDFFVYSGFTSRGVTASPSGGGTSFGIYYDRTYTNWQVFHRTAALGDVVSDSGVAFAPDQTFDFEIRVNITGNQNTNNFEAFIDGVSVGTGISNSNFSMGFVPLQITKTAGTTARRAFLDYVSLQVIAP